MSIKATISKLFQSAQVVKIYRPQLKQFDNFSKFFFLMIGQQIIIFLFQARVGQRKKNFLNHDSNLGPLDMHCSSSVTQIVNFIFMQMIPCNLQFCRKHEVQTFIIAMIAYKLTYFTCIHIRQEKKMWFALIGNSGQSVIFFKFKTTIEV